MLGRFVVGRDEDAFAELVRRHGPLVLGVCRRRVPDAHAAEDAFQAVFVVLATKARQLDAARPLGPWLHGVAVKVAARAGRRLVQRRRREVGSRHLPEVAVTPLARDDATAVLDEELARLSSTYRDALVLCELQGLSRREAAGRLGVAEGTLSSRLAAGRKDLARRLARRGVGPWAVMVGASVSPGLAEAAARGGFTPTSGAVLELSQGVLTAMVTTKLKALFAVAAVALAAFPLVWADEAKPKPAAALPAAAAKEPQFWLLYPESGRLDVVRADGSVARTLKAPDANSILLVSPKQDKVWFRGHNGKAPIPGADPKNPGDGTLHVRALEPGEAATNLGIALIQLAWLFPDGKTLVRTRTTVVAVNDPTRPGASRNEFENELVDVATKAVTKLEHLPKFHHVQGVLAEGKSLLTMEYGDGKEMAKLYQVPVDGGQPRRLVTDKLYLPAPSGLSPDGAKVFLAGQLSRTRFDTNDWGLNAYLLDLATGETTKFSDEARLLHAQGRWSPGGKRVAYTWRAWAKDARGVVSADGVPPTRLVVRDADGKNPKTLVTSEEPFRVVAWE